MYEESKGVPRRTGEARIPAPDAVAQLMEQRAMLMKEVADIDAQMDAIMAMAMKWREIRG